MLFLNFLWCHTTSWSIIPSTLSVSSHLWSLSTYSCMSTRNWATRFPSGHLYTCLVDWSSRRSNHKQQSEFVSCISQRERHSSLFVMESQGIAFMSKPWKSCSFFSVLQFLCKFLSCLPFLSISWESDVVFLEERQWNTWNEKSQWIETEWSRGHLWQHKETKSKTCWKKKRDKIHVIHSES